MKRTTRILAAATAVFALNCPRGMPDEAQAAARIPSAEEMREAARAAYMDALVEAVRLEPSKYHPLHGDKFGFEPQLWRRVVRMCEKDGALRPPEHIDALRLENGAHKKAMVECHTEKNAAALKKNLGRDAKESELFLAHSLGLPGAVEVLKEPGRSALDSLAKAFNWRNLAAHVLQRRQVPLSISSAKLFEREVAQFEKARYGAPLTRLARSKEPAAPF